MGIFSFLKGGGEPDPTAPSRSTAPPAAPRGVVAGTGSSSVHLEDPGAKKINVIKIIREHTGLGLKESKDLADQTPSIVAERVDAAAAQRFVDELSAAGARAYVRGSGPGSSAAGPSAAHDLATPTGAGTSLELTHVGGNAIAVIKAVREITGLGLAEAKDLVDRAPSIVLAGASAEQIVAAQLVLQDVGADVTVR